MTPLPPVIKAAMPEMTSREISEMAARGPNEVYAIDTDEGCLFGKIGTDGGVAREAVLLNQFAGSAAPIPEPVALDPAADPPFVLVRALTGDRLADVTSEDDLERVREVGRALAALHEETAGVASTPACSTQTGLKPRSWSETVTTMVERRAEDLAGTRFEPIAREIVSLVATEMTPLDVKPVVVHNDTKPTNVLVSEAGYRWLDLELSFVGDPAFDVRQAVAAYVEGPNGPEGDQAREELVTAYRNRRPLPNYESRSALYAPVVHLRSLRTFDSWAPRVSEDPDALAEKYIERLRTEIANAR